LDSFSARRRGRAFPRLISHAVLLLSWCGSSHAAFHLWSVQEIYSSADASAQFIEFSTVFSGQEFVSGHTLRITEAAPPNRTNTFTFPGNTGSPTANRTFLVATPGFGSLPGGVTPDFTIPTGFLFTAGATINFAEGSDSVTYGTLPSDGAMSINRFGTPAVNSPRNFAGQTGSVNVPPPSPGGTVSTNLQISGIFIPTGDVELRWNSASTEKYDVVYATELSPTSLFRIAEANIRPSGDGTNVFNRPPFLASPLFDENQELFYALEATANTTSVLPLQLTVVVSNLASPVVLTHAGDGSGRLFIADQGGQVLIIDSNKTLLSIPFLDLSSTISNLAPNGIGGILDPGLNPIFDERGLLGLAFHPEYTNNGRFFVYYSAPQVGSNNHESVVSEFQVSIGDPNIADTNETVLLRVGEPQFNHNAGTLVFGPDDMLYIAFGDGGGANDGLDGSPGHGEFGNGQNISNLLGTIVRIDVDSGSPYAIPPDNPFVGLPGLDEIFAYGFRNPFKMSFDRGVSNRLVVADVGQDVWEEINFVVKGGNHGWRILEGHHAFDPGLLDTLGIDAHSLVYPIHEYHHDIGGISVIGGFFYRGTNYPELVGRYVFGDFSSSFGVPDGKLFNLDESRPGIWERSDFFIMPSNAPLGRFVKGFGEDEDGEIYLLSSTALGPYGTNADIRLLEKP